MLARHGVGDRRAGCGVLHPKSSFLPLAKAGGKPEKRAQGTPEHTAE